MITVTKANRVLTVNETDAEYYLSLGYNQIDENGEIIKRGKFTSVDKAAAAKVADLTAQVEKLTGKVMEAEEYAEKADKKITNLTAQVDELKKANADLTAQAAKK